MNDESSKLLNLPEETRNLLINGIWKCFKLSGVDSKYPSARFFVITDRGYKFLLSWEGNVIFHSSEYTPPNGSELLRENGFLKNYPCLERKVV